MSVFQQQEATKPSLPLEKPGTKHKARHETKQQQKKKQGALEAAENNDKCVYMEKSVDG